MSWFLLAAFSALLSASAAISQKKVLKDLDALEFSFILSIFNVVLSIPFLLSTNFEAVTIINLSALFIKCILGAFAFLNVMLAIKNMEISGALPLMVLTPGIVAVLAFFFIGETLNMFEISGLVLLLGGTYILEMSNKGKLFDPFKVFVESKNHHYILFALGLFTATSILDKVILKEYKLPPDAFLFFQNFFISINFLIMAFFYKKSTRATLLNAGKTYWRWILLISIFTIGYRYTQILAVKIAPVALVLSVKRFSVFFAAIIGGKIFHEHKLLQKAVATIILITGVLFLLNA